MKKKILIIIPIIILLIISFLIVEFIQIKDVEVNKEYGNIMKVHLKNTDVIKSIQVLEDNKNELETLLKSQQMNAKVYIVHRPSLKIYQQFDASQYSYPYSIQCVSKEFMKDKLRISDPHDYILYREQGHHSEELELKINATNEVKRYSIEAHAILESDYDFHRQIDMLQTDLPDFMTYDTYFHIIEETLGIKKEDIQEDNYNLTFAYIFFDDKQQVQSAYDLLQQNQYSATISYEDSKEIGEEWINYMKFAIPFIVILSGIEIFVLKKSKKRR